MISNNTSLLCTQLELKVIISYSVTIILLIIIPNCENCKNNALNRM